MKINLMILFILFSMQQPFDITPHIVDMSDGWSLGNGCNGNVSDYIIFGDVHQNGYNLEANNSKITITGDLYVEGGTRCLSECNYSEIIIQGNIIE